MTPELERLSLLELYREYKYICYERKLNLRPVTIELSDSTSRWGQWHSATRTLSLSKRLVFEFPWQDVMGVLKHEMAHQVVDEVFQNEPKDGVHGNLFKRACEKLGVPPQYAKSGVDLSEHKLDWREENTNSENDRLLDKIKKLLSLAESGNENEASLAMRKVQDLYAKYNLEQMDLHPDYFHLIVSPGKTRFSSWEQKIVSILVEHFFVQVIYMQQYSATEGKHHRAFEIIGTRENVLMAEYVFYFLLNQLEILVKKNGNLNSRIEKMSYRMGILQGFADKLKLSEFTETKQTSTVGLALVQFREDPKIKKHIKQIHPRITTRSISSNPLDSSTFFEGAAEGGRINLRKPLQKASGNLGRLLGFRK